MSSNNQVFSATDNYPTAIFVLPSWAALGDNEQSVKRDPARLRGTSRVVQSSAYSVHEIQSSSAYTVREYVSCCPQRLNLVDNNPFYECAPFVSGYLWGPVVQADLLTLPDGTSEQAFNIQIQVVGPPRQASTPSTCRNSGRGFGHAPGIGADGILGIGVFSNDCGIWCQGYRGGAYIYYSCHSAGCTGASAAWARCPHQEHLLAARFHRLAAS